MQYKYQLILLGTLGELSQKIERLFFDRISELKLLKEAFRIICEENFEADYRGNQPAFAVYFGDKNGDFKHLDILRKLIIDGTMILPVYFEENCFKKHIPCDIHGQNGLLYTPEEDAKIVNLILESFELLRASRKVFISYKRNESSSVAIQLYEALEKNNFNVFLDTHSIKPGERFQDELWHRMTDCDVIVFLNTKDFLESEWCKEEIAEASAKQIGQIQLVWPNQSHVNTAEICLLKQLKETDFENEIFDDKDKSKLISVFVDELVQNVESIRARSLAARQDNLITEFINTARKYDRDVNHQPERFITEKLRDSKRRIFIPTIGVPQSIDCYQSRELKHQMTEYEVESIHLIYDDIRIRDKWLKHLDWLNNYLEIKTLKKQKFDQWLQKEKNIFLSASIPLPERHPKYYTTADVIAIRDAVIALAAIVLPDHRLVWGGHPSITPLIYYVLEKTGVDIQNHVILYQTKLYEKNYPEDNNKFKNVIQTENLGEREPSLELMRKTMFESCNFSAGVFIGGMEGVEEEYQMFKQFHPDALLLPIASTGAAAKIIYDNWGEKNDRFEKDYAYMSLFQEYLINKI